MENKNTDPANEVKPTKPDVGMKPEVNLNSPATSKMPSIASMSSSVGKTAANKVTAGRAGEAAEKVQKAKALAQKIKTAAIAAKTTVTSIAAIITNPAFWVAVLVIVAILFSTVTGMSAIQTFGRNDHADGCAGGSVSVGAFGSDDINVRGSAAASWLMSQDFAFMNGKKLSKVQALGIVGNFAQESQITFNKSEGNGIPKDASNEAADSWSKGGARGLGIIQWTHNPGRAGNLIAKARSMGKQWYDPEVQLNLFKEEIDKTYGSALVAKGFDKATTIETAVKSFHDAFVISADKTMDKRVNYAKQVEKNFNATSASVGGGACRGGVNTSDMAQFAIALSWDSPAKAKVTDPLGDGNTVAKPEYIEARSKLSGYEGSYKNYYADCGLFVATVVRSTKDPDFPPIQTGVLREYMQKSPKWKEVDFKDRQPGDVWVTKAGYMGHISMFVGDINGVPSMAEASMRTHVAYTSPASSMSQSGSDGSRYYHAFRFVG